MTTSFTKQLVHIKLDVTDIYLLEATLGAPKKVQCLTRANGLIITRLQICHEVPHLVPRAPDYLSHNLYHISQTIIDIIIIIGRVYHIYPGIISVTFCAVLPQQSWVIEIFLLLLIFIFRRLLTRKHWKSTTNLYSICISLGYIEVWRFDPRN